MATGSDDQKSLHDAFGARNADKVEQNYAADADLSKTLLVELRTMMGGSPTAQQLFGMADQHGVSVKFLRGREESVYVPENKWLFMSVTPRTRATPRLALLYAGGLREAEQNILGFNRPSNESDDSGWITQNLVKNLDIILKMCIIVNEIVKQNQSASDFLDSLTALGHDDIYEAFVNNTSEEEMLRLLAKKEGLNLGEG